MKKLTKFHDGDSPRRGYLIGSWLILAENNEGWGIFKNINKRNGGGLAVKIYFQNLEDASSFAKTLDKLFKDFLPVYEADPYLNPFDLAKWTSLTHLKAYCVLDILEHSDIVALNSLEPIVSKKFSDTVDGWVSWWTRDSSWETKTSGHLGVV